MWSNLSTIGYYGESLTLQCIVQGYITTSVEYAWTHNSEKVNNSEKHLIEFISKNTQFENGLVYIHSYLLLTISDLTAFDGGNYTCIIPNYFNRPVFTISVYLRQYINNTVNNENKTITQHSEVTTTTKSKGKAT